MLDFPDNNTVCDPPTAIADRSKSSPLFNQLRDFDSYSRTKYDLQPQRRKKMLSVSAFTFYSW